MQLQDDPVIHDAVPDIVSHWVGFIVFFGLILFLVAAIWGLIKSLKLQKTALERVKDSLVRQEEAIAVTHESIALQKETNRLMQEMINALRDNRRI